MPPPRGRWNHSTLYHPVVFEAMPAACRRALDVGCGEGTLTRELGLVVPEVTGIDRDEPSLARARGQGRAPGVHYVHGDVMVHPFEPGSFDLITAVASLHQMDAADGLRRLDELLAPGGVLAVIGMARSSLIDLPIDLGAIVPNRLRRLRAPYLRQCSPTVQPAPESYASMRRLALRLLPDARFERRLYWRYTLVWNKPTA